jgi:proteic killer suppression protein
MNSTAGERISARATDVLDKPKLFCGAAFVPAPGTVAVLVGRSLACYATRHTLDVELLMVYFFIINMIKSFRDRACQRLWMGEFVKRFSGIEKQALRKLDMLHTARQLNDLRAPPANRLEALTGSRRGQHSIRINDQWRICFIWTEEGPADVEIVDYH